MRGWFRRDMVSASCLHSVSQHGCHLLRLYERWAPSWSCSFICCWTGFRLWTSSLSSHRQHSKRRRTPCPYLEIVRARRYLLLDSLIVLQMMMTRSIDRVLSRSKHHSLSQTHEMESIEWPVNSGNTVQLPESETSDWDLTSVSVDKESSNSLWSTCNQEVSLSLMN